ncbi:MAG: outer membrane protein assembly factor BamC [Rhizobacter sp.]|nr:outer membrane protein assembly factor BamC [Rhizobacter sp.]
MLNVIRVPHRVPVRSLATAVSLVCALAACSSIENFASGDKVDYRSAKVKPTPLEVPPDLTQLAVDPRYAPQAGVVSAAALQAPGAAASAPVTNAVAPSEFGDVRLVRQGNMRYLSTRIPPDQLWPQLEAFWKERGLALVVDQPDVGVMETDWAENRAKLSDDIIRRTLGRVFDSLYSTGERDKFRTRVERSDNGTDIYITHRGMEEVYTNQLKDSTTWKPRPNDPLLEGEMLSRLMVKLGAKAEAAKAEVAKSNGATEAVAPARARVLTDRPAATLQLDESFDRAWRRVGLALDRSGFTVEDRDRNQGLYFVRYVDPAQAGKEEPGFFAKLFTNAKLSGPTRYRVSVKAEGEASTVSVFDAQGAPENGDAGQRIVKLLVDDLK